jgi:error-prone DNA polymerase
LREIKGFRQAAAEALMEKRGAGYATPADLLRRARLTRSDLALLADADAYGSLALDRRGAGWDVAGLEAEALPLFAEKPCSEPAADLPRMALGDEVAEDYAVTGLSLKRHPMALLRPLLARDRVIPTAALSRTTPGRRVAVAGLVLVRQQPGSAKGTIFMTIEDETGIANLIVWPAVYELHRRAVLGGSLVTAIGRVQREGLVVHLVVETLIDRGAVLKRLRTLDDQARESQPSRSDPHLPEEFRRLSRDFR